MRSRAAIILMLVFGFAFSGLGTGLALSQDTTPAEAQYGPAPTDKPSGGGVNPDEDEEPGDTLDEGGVAGEDNAGGNAPVDRQAAGGGAPEQDVQVVRQTGFQDSGDSLPMTGFAAIPVLLIGIALLVGGFVLRGSARKGADA